MAGRVNIDIFLVNHTLQNTYAVDAKLMQKAQCFFLLDCNAARRIESDRARGNG